MWISDCQYPEQTNRLNSYVTNRHKMHRNRYNCVKSCLVFMLKGNQLRNSLTQHGKKMMTTGTAILK